MDGSPIVFSVALLATLVAVGMFGRTLLDLVRLVRVGQADPTRTDYPGARTRTMLVETLGHTRMLKWTIVGAAHWFVFVGFGLLFLTLVTAYGQLLNPGFHLPLIGTWAPYLAVIEFVAFMTFVGILYLIYRRQREHPRIKGRQSRFEGSNMNEGYFVEAIILIVAICVLTLRGLEGALMGVTSWEPAHLVTYPLTAAFSGLSTGTVEALIVTVATIKITTSLTWFVVVAMRRTMGVAWHRFTVFFNVWFKRHADGRIALGELQPMRSGGVPIDFEDPPDDATFGIGVLDDMTWKGRLDLLTCTECGRCQSQCPAWATEKPLSPKLLITASRNHMHAADLDPSLKELPMVGDTDQGAIHEPAVIWSCTSCGACVNQCPVDIEHVDLIMDMRRHQVLVASDFPTELSGMFRNVETKGNPWGMGQQGRTAWIEELDFPIRVFGADGNDTIPDDVEWLFWVGCAGAYDDRAKKTTKAVAELLHIADVEFMVLGDGETCTGDPARRAGNEFLFQMQAQQNVEVLNEVGAKRIVVTCPHCLNTISREYPQLGGNYEVVHHTQLLNDLVAQKKLTPLAPVEGSIAYHDPCYLGRHNQVYEPPRELLGTLTNDMRELGRSRETSFCCGAGGARMWMEERIGTRINLNRTDEAIASGADTLAVGCPFCQIMLSDGATVRGTEAGSDQPAIKVRDVATLMLDGIKPARSDVQP
jgi:Fe-S oxidoreductase